MAAVTWSALPSYKRDTQQETNRFERHIEEHNDRMAYDLSDRNPSSFARDDLPRQYKTGMQQNYRGTCPGKIPHARLDPKSGIYEVVDGTGWQRLRTQLGQTRIAASIAPVRHHIPDAADFETIGLRTPFMPPARDRFH